VTLSQSVEVRTLELPRKPVAQKTESADGMIYAAEPADASAQALVLRIPIRLEQ
jgi:hypothetical protein